MLAESNIAAEQSILHLILGLPLLSARAPGVGGGVHATSANTRAWEITVKSSQSLNMAFAPRRCLSPGPTDFG